MSGWVERGLAQMPRVYRMLRSARFAVGRALPPVHHGEIRGRVHRNDVMMWNESPTRYRRVGEEAAELFERALIAAGHEPDRIGRVLDFGAGYGRVTRVLADRFGPERVSVFDVNDEGARFCAAEFGVRHVPFEGDWGSIPFGCYDAIWAGSVLTHLDEKLTRTTIGRLVAILERRGALVVTTQGKESLRRLKDGGYGARFAASVPNVDEAVASTGFAFLPYAHSLDGTLGMTWMTDEFLDRMIAATGGAERVAFWPAAWDAHQDVHVFRRSGMTPSAPR